MPTVNIYAQGNQESLKSLTPDIKKLVADKLSCRDIALSPTEVSVRLLEATGDGMLGAVEVDIFAHAFSERVERQDQICLEVAEYLSSATVAPGDIRVWLMLGELGHSWK
jgi:hypothetical protein